MDWVDYKRYVMRYNKPYFDGYKRVHRLFLHVLHSYSEYRSYSTDGYIECVCVKKYGEFLYYLAKLENMVSQHLPKNCEGWKDTDWGMMSGGLSIVTAYTDGKIDGEELCMMVRNWIKSYRPIVYSCRLYEGAMVQSTHDLQEKHGY